MKKSRADDDQNWRSRTTECYDLEGERLAAVARPRVTYSFRRELAKVSDVQNEDLSSIKVGINDDRCEKKESCREDDGANARPFMKTSLRELRATPRPSTSSRSLRVLSLLEKRSHFSTDALSGDRFEQTDSVDDSDNYHTGKTDLCETANSGQTNGRIRSFGEGWSNPNGRTGTGVRSYGSSVFEKSYVSGRTASSDKTSSPQSNRGSSVFEKSYVSGRTAPSDKTSSSQSNRGLPVFEKSYASGRTAPSDKTSSSQSSNPVEKLRQLQFADPSEALMAMSPRSGLFKFYTYEKLTDVRLIEILIKVLQNACRSTHSPKLLSHLLKEVSESGFLTGHLLNHIVSRSSDLEDAVVIATCDVSKALLHHLPSYSLSNVNILLAQLSRWVDNRSRIFADLHKEAMDAVRSVDETAKSTAKQIRRGDLVRDQEAEKEECEEPPDDFRKIPTYPTVSEIRSAEAPFLRKNIIFGAYRDVDHYLDVQYRLLREDFVCPLREGLKTLQEYKEKNIPLGRLSDIRFYSNVRVQTTYCTNRCVLYRISFDVSRFYRVRWESSKRLIFGSLVGLSRDDFQNIAFGTVAARQPEDLQKGLVDICFEDENAYLLDLNPYTEYQMVECSAYFEAFRHTLEGLQEIQPGNLPFEQYVLNKSQGEVLAPRYLREQNATYDFSILCEGSKRWRSVPVLDRMAWPKYDALGLDESQYAALHTAITKEFVTIQGPPGTGKTFIGLKIVQLLLENKQYWFGGSSPILIVCFTNHALDQFLEGIFDLCHLTPGQLVRVGGRSSSEKMKSCCMFEVKKKIGVRASAYGQNAISEVFESMTDLQNQITGLASQMNFARENLIHEMYLQQYMTEVQAASLFSVPMVRDGSLLLEWLGTDVVEAAATENKEERVNATEADELILEDDEYEVIRMQEERQIEGTFISPHLRKHLDAIDEASEACPLQISMQSDDSEKWQIERNKKKIIKSRKAIQRKLQSIRAMSREEWIHVGNVWSLPVLDRWRLYNYWVSCFCEEKALQIRHVNAEFSRLTSRLEEIYAEDDFAALRQALVVGMTTTGAAKYRRLLQRIRPRIVIVEEAAEVMESHIVTTLSPHCQHLIMIGDHQQLRPSTTVYKLAKNYHLDISLFERMVKNDLRCDRLSIQHRMRPEIVKLIVPHIYESLENHESVLCYENIRGIKGNVFFITHSEMEMSVEDTKSRSNMHEARFLTALCRYLMQQGYQGSQITVLTTYTGQMFLLRRTMPKSLFGDVRISPVDNYQGEENDIILLSLVRSNAEGKIGFLQIQNRVCVALSRAKKGLFVIGNMDVMADASGLWNGIARDLKQNGQLVEALPLACENHPTTIIYAKTMEDFAKAPEGGCMLDCGIRLKCGHVCERKCHPTDRDHVEYECNKPCVKILCDSGHRCVKRCYETCGKCEVVVQKTIPNCGHVQMVKCHVPPEKFICKLPCEKILKVCGHKCQNTCGQPCSTECSVVVPDRPWPCGHLLSVDCSLNPANFKCIVLVRKTLPCGHSLELSCGDDADSHKCTEEVCLF
jgi:hypothetical protein